MQGFLPGGKSLRGEIAKTGDRSNSKEVRPDKSGTVASFLQAASDSRIIRQISLPQSKYRTVFPTRTCIINLDSN